MPLSPKFKPIPPAEPVRPVDELVKSAKERTKVDAAEFKEDSQDQSEGTATDADNDSQLGEEEVTVSVVGGRVIGGKGRGRKRKGSTRKTKPP